MSDNSIVTMEKHSIAWSKALSVLIILAGILAIAVPRQGESRQPF
jgi:uncharacterized membrane protein YdcZ (DUF606 family)